MAFKLRIITPRGDYFKGDVDLLNIKTEQGYIGVLPKHFPLIAMIDVAPMYIKNRGVIKHYAISGGILNVKKHETIILANAIESQEEIDVERAQKAKERAEKRLSKKDNVNIDVQRANMALMRAVTRINVKNNY